MSLRNSVFALMVASFCAGAFGQSPTPPASSGTNTNASVTLNADALTADAAKRCPAFNGVDDGGFFIGDASGAKLHVGGDFQFRYTANLNRESSYYGEGDEFYNHYTGGFSTNMARLRMNGTVAHDWDFNFSGAFRDASTGGYFHLENAFVSTSPCKESRVQFGQFKLPFMAEASADDRFQMGASRGVISSLFGQGYSQGIQVQYNKDRVQLFGAFSDGFNTDNSFFTDSRESSYSFTGRANYLITGDRKALDQFSSELGSTQSVMAGVAAHFQDGAYENVFSYTADVNWQNDGKSFFAAFVGRHGFDGSDNYTDFGVEFQGAYRCSSNNEIFARWETFFADNSRGWDVNRFNFATVGYNHYFAGQNARFTLQGVYSFNPTSNMMDCGFGDTGLLGSSGAGEAALVAQFQFAF